MGWGCHPLFARTSDNKKKTIKIDRTKKTEGDALNILKSMVSEKKAAIWKKTRKGISRTVRRTFARKGQRGAKGISKYRCTPLLLLHDQPGRIRAYKLTNESGEGPFQGGITYELGKTYKVMNANCDEAAHCAAGINLATLDWCINNWKRGYRILIAEFSAKDIAVIPTATDGKFRVHRCKIVGVKDLKEMGLEE